LPVDLNEGTVSAVIPAYNAELFLGETIESVLDQTVEVAEIIVVDDGSSDRTGEVAAGFPRTRVIRRANGGQSAARNTGIQAAKGDWIALLDHDDVWFPRKTEVQLGSVRPDTGVVHGNPFDPINFGNLWHRQAHITPSGAMVRKQALLEVGGFEESRSVQGVEDLNLWLKIALTEWRFVQAGMGLFQWRQTGQNQSGNELKMARAELASIASVGARHACQPAEIERLKQACRIEYAKNLTVGRLWDKAGELLDEGAMDLAARWLSLACFVKVNRLARTNIVRWLQSVDGGYEKHLCSGECNLPELQRKQCMASSSRPYYRLPNVGI